MTTSKKDTVIYILEEVLEFPAEKTEKLISKNCDTFTKLRNISAKTLQKLCDNGELSDVECDMISAFQDWCTSRRDAGVIMPSSLSEWRTSLTTETLNDGEFKEKNKDKVQISTSENLVLKSTLSVKLSDYPYFKGSQNSWLDFKQAFIATATLAGLGHLFDVSVDIEEHLEKRRNDPTYNMNCRDLYGILSTKTAGGLASQKVTKHLDTADGVMAWRDLLTYWDLTADVTAYASQKLAELNVLEFRSHVPGDIDQYIAKHDLLCSELARADENLSDKLKKLFFLNGIKDSAFNSVKDLCSKLSLQETILEVRKKAQSLTRTQANGQHGRRQNMKQQRPWEHLQKSPRGKTLPHHVWENMTPKQRQLWNEATSQENNNTDNNSSHGLPEGVFDEMSLEDQNIWTESVETKQNNYGKTTKFGPQYGTRGQHPNVTKVKEPEDDDTRYQIWRPAGSKNENKTSKTRKQNLFKSIPKPMMQGLNNTNKVNPKGSLKMNPNKDQTNKHNYQIFYKKDLFDRVIGPMSTVPSKEDTVENDWNKIYKDKAPKEVHYKNENPTNQLGKDPNIETMKEIEPENEETPEDTPTMESMVNDKINNTTMEIHEEKGEITQPKFMMNKGHKTMDTATIVRGDCQEDQQPPSIGELEPKMTKFKGRTGVKFKTKPKGPKNYYRILKKLLFGRFND